MLNNGLKAACFPKDYSSKLKRMSNSECVLSTLKDASSYENSQLDGTSNSELCETEIDEIFKKKSCDKDNDNNCLFPVDYKFESMNFLVV